MLPGTSLIAGCLCVPGKCPVCVFYAVTDGHVHVPQIRCFCRLCRTQDPLCIGHESQFCGFLDPFEHPYLGLGAADMAQLGIAEGHEIEAVLGGETRVLPVRETPGLPQGIVGVPRGVGQLQGFTLPVWTSLGGAS